MLPCGLDEGQPWTFLDWYMHAAGQSMVPDQFHLWMGIQLISVCVQDRVVYEKFKGSKMSPNLYVMLIGPSGTGKGRAISVAQNVIRKLPPDDLLRVQMYRGKLTPQALISRLGAKDKDGNPAPNYIWFITPELAMAVGSNNKADDFVKHMTELYEGDCEFIDTTRMYGEVSVQDPCINWSSGSTREWLLESVGKQDILSGFFARVCAVPAARKVTRYPDPEYPPDWDTVHAYLVQYASALCNITGTITMSDAAKAHHVAWYMKRPEPEDEMLQAFFARSDDLVLKLASLLALADNLGMVIEVRHLVGAIRLSNWVMNGLPEMLEYAHRTPETEMLQWLSTYLKGHCSNGTRSVSHTAVLKAASNRGANSERLRDLMKTLIERQDVAMAPMKKGSGGKRYQWLGEE